MPRSGGDCFLTRGSFRLLFCLLEPIMAGGAGLQSRRSIRNFGESCCHFQFRVMSIGMRSWHRELRLGLEARKQSVSKRISLSSPIWKAEHKSRMLTLGVNYTRMHDSSACVVRDGELLFAVAEERISRLKHDAGFPKNAIRACLDFVKVGPEELDEVCC